MKQSMYYSDHDSDHNRKLVTNNIMMYNTVRSVCHYYQGSIITNHVYKVKNTSPIDICLVLSVIKVAY